MCNSSKIKQLRDDLKDMAFEMHSLMEEPKVVRKESLIEKFVVGLSMISYSFIQLHLWGTHSCMDCMATFGPRVFDCYFNIFDFKIISQLPVLK
uniref:Uncharacterized protein n=1 Tax=Vitis vinifera TaxID=29760 RepID=F6HXT2_VITVI